MAASTSSDDLVARVVAWHNQHPLAQRITRAHVVSLGLVSFPFRLPPGAVPRMDEMPASRAIGQAAGPAASKLARRARQRWWPAFNEDPLAPYTRRELARWTLRHGSEERPGPADAPMREFEADAPAPPALRDAQVVRLWSFIVAIDLGAQRVRLLVSATNALDVFGSRIHARGRVGIAGAVLAAGLASVALAWVGGLLGVVGKTRPMHPMAAASAAAEVAVLTPAPAPAPAASSTAVAPRSASAAAVSPPPAPPSAAPVSPATPTSPPPRPLTPAQPQPAATPAPAPLPTPSPSPSPGSLPRTALPHVVPFLSEATRQAAREAGDEARAERSRQWAARLAAGMPETGRGAADTARGADAHTASASSPLRAVRTAVPDPNAATLATATAWAVSTRSLRTRFEGEQMLAALRDAAYHNGLGREVKLEILPAGDDWRAVGWPFATRAEAERLRASLAARGLKTEVVQF